MHKINCEYFAPRITNKNEVEWEALGQFTMGFFVDPDKAEDFLFKVKENSDPLAQDIQDAFRKHWHMETRYEVSMRYVPTSKGKG